MAKIGKYSTGLSGAAKMAGKPYGQSNKGWEARKSLTGEMTKSAPIGMSPRGTATGKPVPVKK